MKGQELKPLHEWVHEWVNECVENIGNKNTKTFKLLEIDKSWELTCKLAELLSRKPTLSDFIPCDKNGKPLEKPVMLEKAEYIKKHEAYQEAEQRVLWEGDWVYSLVQDEIIIYNDIVILLDYDLTYSDLTDKGLIFKRDL